MKEYEITFARSGDVFRGAPEEVVRSLRVSSQFESDISDKAYMRHFARRHNRFVGGERVLASSPTKFLISLGLSELISRFVISERE